MCKGDWKINMGTIINLNIIRKKAAMDVDFGSGLATKEEFFGFLDSVNIEKTDKLYDKYINYYKDALDLVCEWANALYECFDD